MADTENVKMDVSTKEEAPQQVNLARVTVDSQNTAFNLLISFIAVAQKRGAFNLEEAAKIFECIKIFQTEEKK